MVVAITDRDRFIGLQHETKSKPARMHINIVFHTCVRDLQQFFLSPDQDNESIRTNHSFVISQVSLLLLLYVSVFSYTMYKNKIIKIKKLINFLKRRVVSIARLKKQWVMDGIDWCVGAHVTHVGKIKQILLCEKKNQQVEFFVSNIFFF